MKILKTIKIKSRLAKLKSLVETSCLKGQCPYKIYRRVKALTIDNSEQYVRVLMDAFNMFQRSTGYYNVHLNERKVCEPWIIRTLSERNLEDEYKE